MKYLQIFKNKILECFFLQERKVLAVDLPVYGQADGADFVSDIVSYDCLLKIFPIWLLYNFWLLPQVYDLGF